MELLRLLFESCTAYRWNARRIQGLLCVALVTGSGLLSGCQNPMGSQSLSESSFRPGLSFSLSQSTTSVAANTVSSGSSVQVTFTARDVSGAALSLSGLSVVFSTSGGTSTGTFSSVTDRGGGIYTADFTGALPGTPTTIITTVGGEVITTAAPTIQVSNPAPTVTSLSRNAGTQGATLTITGTGFLSGLTARIGSTNCTTSTHVSATSATCLIPSSATIATMSVTVTNTDGQSGVLAASFTHLMNPIFWFRGDVVTESGGLVSSWTDLTTNGNHVTQSGAPRPTYASSVAAFNNQPALLFNGTNSELLFSGSGLNVLRNKAGLSYAAALTTADNTRAQQTIWFWGTSVAAATRFTAFLNDTNAGTSPCAASGFLSTSGRKVDGGSTWFRCMSNSTPANNAAFIASTNLNFATNAAATAVNGTASSTASGMTLNTAGANSTDVASNAAKIGNGTASRYLQGYLAEIVFYDSDIGATQRQALENYLKTRYNIP